MDTVSTQVRSSIMSRIRGEKTSMEVTFARALRKSGLRFKQNARSLGCPDFVLKGAAVVVFLDSCFWHCCPRHFRRPSSRTHYWRPKIEQNVRRDAIITRIYRGHGWKVLRFWEHTVTANLESCVQKTKDAVSAYAGTRLELPNRRRVLSGCVRFDSGSSRTSTPRRKI